MVSEYWVVSVPNEGGVQEATLKLQNAVERRGASKHYVVKLPGNLRVGTLDSLIAMSDDLGEKDQDVVEALQRIARIYDEQSDSKEQVLYVKQKLPDSYIETFKWNTQTYSPVDSLQKIVDTVRQNVSRNVTTLSKIQNTIAAIKTKLTNIEKKTSGSLVTRDLHDYVKRSEWLDGPYVTSALVCVPTSREGDFLQDYESLEKSPEAARLREAGPEVRERLKTEEAKSEVEKNDALLEKFRSAAERADILDSLKCPMVVPGSAIKLTEDAEFKLYRVLLLRKCSDVFSAICRDRRYTVRKFNIDDVSSKVDEKQKDELTKKMHKETTRLLLLCQTFYSDVFVGYMHLKMVRVFVESVLRYGLPVNFSVSLIKPQKGAEKRLTKTLETNYAHLAGMSAMKKTAPKKKKDGEKKEEDLDYTGLGAEFRPYVFSKIFIRKF